MPGPDLTARVWDDVSMVATARGPVEVGRTGSGPAILVVHGVPGSWRQAMTIAEDLADTNTIVAPSRPGYGRTPVSSGRSYDEQADLYAATLDVLGIDRVVVVGASGGGPSSIAFAARHPGRTAGLVLACAMSPELIAVPAPLRLLAVPVLGEALSALERFVSRRRITNDAAIDRRLATDLTPDEQRRLGEEPAMRDWLIAFARTHLDAPAGLAGIRNDLVQVRAAQAANAALPAVAAPTLVLHGDADEVCPMTHAERHATIAGAVLETYADAGHIFFVTRRRESSERIRRFAVEVLPR